MGLTNSCLLNPHFRLLAFPLIPFQILKIDSNLFIILYSIKTIIDYPLIKSVIIILIINYLELNPPIHFIKLNFLLIILSYFFILTLKMLSKVILPILTPHLIILIPIPIILPIIISFCLDLAF